MLLKEVLLSNKGATKKKDSNMCSNSFSYYRFIICMFFKQKT